MKKDINLENLLLPLERDNRIDTIRGLLLISMTIDHYSGWIFPYIWQPLGFTSDAEGFIFMSGFVFALVYSKYLLDHTVFAMHLIKRAFLVYRYHMLMVIIIPLLSLLLPAARANWKNMLTYFYNVSFIKYLFASLIIVNQPSFMDVLPMYAIFILMSWPVMYLLSKGRNKTVIFSSIVLWGIGQYINPFSLLSRHCFPGSYPGIFNVLGWQLMFIIGVFFGFQKRIRANMKFLDNKILSTICFIIAIGLLVLRYTVNPNTLILLKMSFRDNLGWMRVVDFFAIVYVVYFVLKFIPLKAKIPWVHFLGKHSLQVFAFHIVIIYLVLSPLGFGWEIYNKHGNFIYFLGMFLFVASLSIPAYLHKLYSLKIKEKK